MNEGCVVRCPTGRMKREKVKEKKIETDGGEVGAGRREGGQEGTLPWEERK